MTGSRETSRHTSPYLTSDYSGGKRLSQLAQLRGMHPDLIRRMIDNVSFIADQFRAMKNENQVGSAPNFSTTFLVPLSVPFFSQLSVAFVCGKRILSRKIVSQSVVVRS